MSRQNYYATHKRRLKQQVDEDFIINMVRSERSFQLRLGGRKLYFLLKNTLEENGVLIGRDRFFDILRN